MNISVFQLHQSVVGTSAATLTLNNSQIERTEITHIFVCNTTGSAVTFRLFHDDDGTTYTAATALYYDLSIAANTTLEVISETLNGGIALQKNGNLGAEAGTASALTISIYGHNSTVE